MSSDMEAAPGGAAERLTQPLLSGASTPEGTFAAAPHDAPKNGAQQWACFECEYVSRATAAVRKMTLAPQAQAASHAAACMQNPQSVLESEPQLISVILVIVCASGFLAYLAVATGLAFVGMLEVENALIMGLLQLLNLLIGMTITRCVLIKSWRTMLRAVNELSDVTEAISFPLPKRCTPEAHLAGTREVSSLSLVSTRLLEAVHTLSCYVPSHWLRRILKRDPATTTPLSLYPAEVTVMFTDIANYTSLCESLPKERLRVLLGAYFEAAIWVVHNFEGFVAEILGDGLLIFWNAPADVTDSCGKACLAAIAQRRTLEVLNRRLEGEGLPRLEVRIGINTGQVYAGNIGSSQRMKFGCMGDSVNTAARLEGLCKVLGVRIILSDAVRSQLPNWGFLCRPLGRVRLKGKYEIVTVHELMEPPEPPSDCEESSPRVLGPELLSETAARMVAKYSQLPAEEPRGAGAASSSSDSMLSGEQRQCLPGTGHSSCVTSSSATDRETFLPSYSDEQQTLRTQSAKALDAFHAADFTRTVDVLETLCRQQPKSSQVASLYMLLERARQQVEKGSLSDPEQATWTGVLQLGEK